MRRIWLTGGGSVLVATIIAAILLAGQPAPVACDSTVTTRNGLVSALSSVANSGTTVCVTADITGDAITVTTDFTSQARFVAQPENMTISIVPLTLVGVSHVTVQGFEFTGGGVTLTNGGNSSDVSIIGNHFHDYVGNGVIAFGGVDHTNVAISGNWMQCVAYPPLGDPTGPTGYGIYNDAFVTGFTATYNTIDGCNDSSDGMQLAVLANANVSYNVIENIGWSGVGSDPHADAAMIWGTSHDVTFSNNRILDSTGVLMSPDSDDVLAENNLIVGMAGQCVDSTANGSSGNVSPLRHTWRRNTIWNCGNGGINLNQPTDVRGQNVADRNLVVELECFTADVWSSQDNHNLVGNAKACWPGATNQGSFSPTFADTIDYLPLNLPSGYGDVGYRRVPAGHTAYQGSL